MEKFPKLRAKDTKGLAPLLIAFVVVEFMVRAPSRIVPAPGLQDLAKRHEELANRWNDFGKEARELVICRVNIRQMDMVHFYKCGLALSDDTDVACLGWKHCPTDKRKLGK
ncbi:hypothetical protein V1264_017684 [Littorina saxatilis]|uniref:Uncharacterized protein n=1 Tax=Littorina saxatilis TaxID=31220 RepID=A0AAN9BIW4_9CAEN